MVVGYLNLFTLYVLCLVMFPKVLCRGQGRGTAVQPRRGQITTPVLGRSVSRRQLRSKP